MTYKYLVTDSDRKPLFLSDTIEKAEELLKEYIGFGDYTSSVKFSPYNSKYGGDDYQGKFYTINTDDVDIYLVYYIPLNHT